MIPRDGVQRWFLIDNAPFHGILRQTAVALGRAHVGITHTAPSSCFLNPIEEFFAQLASKFQEMYGRAVLKHDRYIIPRDQVKEMIIRSAQIVGRRDCAAIFERAGLI